MKSEVSCQPAGYAPPPASVQGQHQQRLQILAQRMGPGKLSEVHHDLGVRASFRSASIRSSYASSVPARLGQDPILPGRAEVLPEPTRSFFRSRRQMELGLTGS
jgi:hypothetical protein